MSAQYTSVNTGKGGVVHMADEAGLPRCGGKYDADNLFPNNDIVTCKKCRNIIVALVQAERHAQAEATAVVEKPAEASELTEVSTYTVTLSYDGGSVTVRGISALSPKEAILAAYAKLTATVEMTTTWVMPTV